MLAPYGKCQCCRNFFRFSCCLLPSLAPPPAARHRDLHAFSLSTLSGTFAASWIAKEAGYYAAEGLDIELIRVGGSSRIVGAMLGGTASIIHAGAPASMAATAAGSDSVIIGCMSIVSPFHLMARPD